MTRAGYLRPPSKRIRIFLNQQLSLSGYHYHPHVSGGRIRQSHLNPLSRLEIFEYANSNIDLARAESEALVDISFYRSLKQNLESHNARRCRQQKQPQKLVQSMCLSHGRTYSRTVYINVL